VRAVVQLTAVSSVIVVVARSLWLSALFVLVMFTVRPGPRQAGGCCRRCVATWLPIAAGVVPVLAVVLGCRAVPLTGIAVVPIAASSSAAR